jgi:predicted ATPase/class 3 adenylate cyclase
MRARLRDYSHELELPVPLEIVIGINTGQMVAGDIAGPVIREFHVLGDAVNLAARMKARAPLGRIYLGPETEAEIRGQHVMRRLEPVLFKGKSAPVPVFELLAAEGARLGLPLGAEHIAFSGLVGREPELGVLRAFAARTAGGTGGVLLLRGEEGSGKSRLLAELVSAPELEKLRVFHGSARRADLAGQLLAAVAPAAEDGVRQAPSAGSAAALREALCSAASRPALVVVDDLDAADADARALVTELLSLASELSLGLVLASRPQGEMLLGPFRAAHAAFFEELALAPLAPDAQRQLVDALVGSSGIDPETRALVEARGGGNPARLVLATFLAPALRSEAASNRAGARSADTERRRATLLFADISGFTAMTERLGAEVAYPIVVGCLRLLDEIARKYGGTVDKYLGDCVFALFGVPQAIEDAPRAALNAAIEMRRAVRRYNEEHALAHRLDVHSGIETGLGIAGDISGPLIREFAVMGDAVSLADQLKDVAPEGRIYVGPEAWQATREVFELAALEPVSIRGREASFTAYELRSEEPRLYRARLGAERQVFSALVGRESELASLRATLARLHEGQGGIVNLIAEAGLGKSRLVKELSASPEGVGVTWLEGRSLSNGQQLSFHPFADLGRAWAGITDDDDEAVARAKLEAGVRLLLPDQADEVFPFLATLVGLRLEGEARERVERMQGDARSRRLQRATADLLRAQSERGPVVLVLDDLHWADQSSIDLLEVLLPSAADRTILFLHVFRPGFTSTSGRVLEIVRAHHGERQLDLALHPLDARATRRLIANLFRDGEVPHETRRLIEEKAQGNPFYVEEVVRALLDAEAVELHEGRFRATERIHAFVVPGTIQEVVTARLDRLDAEKRRILQIASVIGGSFHRDVLEEIHGAAQLDARIAELQQGAFLEASDRSAGVEYGFKHPLIQEVTYDGILQERREELHREVALAMERRLPADLAGREGMLAYHWSLGRDAERAEDHLFRAGHAAARAAGSSEALHFFREASRLYFDLHGEGGDPVKKARLQRSIASALYYRGQLVDAVEAFSDAMESLGERVPRRQPAMALRFVPNLAGALARLYLRRGRRPPADPVRREVIDLMFQRALCEVTADATRFLFDSVALLAKLSRVDPASVSGAGGMYAASSVIFSFGGLSFAVGRRLLAAARAAVDETDVPELLLYRMMNFTHHFFEGDWGDAHEISDELLREGLARGRTWDVLSYLLGQTDKRIAMGDFALARRQIAWNDEIWERYQNELARSQHHYLTTRLLLEERRLTEARDSAQTYYEEIQEPVLHVHALGLRGQAEALLGELDAAEATLAHCAAVIREQGELTVPQYMRSQYLRSRLLVDVARLEQAVAAGDAVARRTAARRARRIARRAARSVAWVAARRPEVYRLIGTAHWHAGQPRNAATWWARSVAEAERLGARPDLARTWLEIGLLLGTASPAERSVAGTLGTEAPEIWIDRARVSFDALGLAFDRRRCDTTATLVGDAR